MNIPSQQKEPSSGQATRLWNDQKQQQPEYNTAVRESGPSASTLVVNRRTVGDVKERLDCRRFYESRLKLSPPPNSHGEAAALCPFHSDHSPSLSVNLRTGLFKCHGCPAAGDVIGFQMQFEGVDFRTALEQLAEIAGVADSDKRSVVATFHYHDAAGRPLYSKERIEPGRGGRKKEFRFFHLDIQRKRRFGRGCSPVLYRLPVVLKAETVFVVEGEAKADLLESWQLAATCLDSGAQSTMSQEMVSQLSGKRVAILPDNDKPGREYADRLASVLHGKAQSLRIVELPGLAAKGDILDWTRE